MSKDSGKLSTSRKGLKSPAGSDQEESLERNDSKKLERKRKHHGQLLMKSNKN